MKERDYLWDNIKALLIFLVVAGHFLELSTLNTGLARAIDTFIYSFHMPAFIFVSGFFAKRYCTDGKVKAVKAATLFAYYIVFQLLFISIRCIMNIHTNSISLFSPGRGLWYLFVLFLLYLITPIVEKLPAWFVVPVSIVLALLVSRDTKASSYMSILRLFTFAPYYFIGYYLSSDTVKKLRAIKPPVRLSLAFLCAACSVSLMLFNLDQPWNKLFYGKINNARLHMSFGEASLLRLDVYLIALLMIAALLLAIPDKKSPIAKLGQNSLQIYIIHMAFVIILFDSEIVDINVNNNLILFVGLFGSLAVTVLLSLWFFGYPFKWIQTGVKKLYSIKSKD